MDHNFRPFTIDDVAEAIRQSSNSTALGPDGITHLHLKQFGPKALAYLTELYNLSVSKAEIPAIWKEATIIPILKPGKPVAESTSYRPISLLSPCVKVLERLLLPSCKAAFELSPNQHGFRSMRSTATALLPMATLIAQGFNDQKPPRRTAIVALDISTYSYKTLKCMRTGQNERLSRGRVMVNFYH